MTLLWSLDLSRADCVAAGMLNHDYNRQTAAGNGAASGLPWPIPTSTAPDGRRAIPTPLPDRGRRNEMTPNHAEFTSGDAFFGTTVWIPGDFPPGNVGSKYQVFEQLRQQDNTGSPPLAFEIRDGRLRVTGGFGMTGAPSPAAWAFDRVILDPCPLDRWLPIVYKITNFSTTAGASTLDVWLAGQQLLAGFTLPPPTVVGSSGGTYRKLGYYRDPANPPGNLFVGPCRYGTLFASVDTTAEVWTERAVGPRGIVAV